MILLFQSSTWVNGGRIYLGGKVRAAWEIGNKVYQEFISAGVVTQMVQYLPNKHKTLGLIISTKTMKKRGHRKCQ
jgi:hypothetical protein